MFTKASPLRAALALSALAAGQPLTAAPAQDQLMLVFNTPSSSRLAPYTHWYDIIHAPDIMSVPEFESAQRAQAITSPADPGLVAPRPFMMRYRLHSDDLARTFAAIPKGDPAHPAPIARDGYALSFDARSVERPGRGPLVLHRAAAVHHYDLYILGDAANGREDAYTHWLDNVQIPQILRRPGVVGAQRFVRSDVQRDRTGPSPRHLVVYRIATNRIDRVMADLAADRLGGDAAHGVDESTMVRFLYIRTGPLIERTHRTAAHPPQQRGGTGN